MKKASFIREIPQCIALTVLVMFFVMFSTPMTVSASRFSDGGGGSISTGSAVITVRITPEKATVPLGGEQKFEAVVTGTNNHGVAWSLVGNTDENTKIDTEGKLVIGNNEGAKALTIKANSNASSNSSGLAIVSISNLPAKAKPSEPTENAHTVKFKIGSTIYWKTQNGITTEHGMDAAPFIKDGRTMLPVRALGEAIGAEIAWDGDSKVAIITDVNNAGEANKSGNTFLLVGEKPVVLKIALGEDTAVLNGESVKIGVPAMLVDDRAYLPLRFIAEAFNLSASWDEATETITIDLE